MGTNGTYCKVLLIVKCKQYSLIHNWVSHMSRFFLMNQSKRLTNQSWTQIELVWWIWPIHWTISHYFCHIKIKRESFKEWLRNWNCSVKLELEPHLIPYSSQFRLQIIDQNALRLFFLYMYCCTVNMVFTKFCSCVLLFFFWAGLIVSVSLIKTKGTSAVSADFTNAFELEWRKKVNILYAYILPTKTPISHSLEQTSHGVTRKRELKWVK